MSTPVRTRPGGVPARILLDLPLDQVDPDPDNPRTHLGDVVELAESMHTTGLLQPILVRRAGARFTVVAGHRRLAAARHLRWASIPAMIRRDIRPDDVLPAMLAENGVRTGLDPIDEAHALRRLAREQKLATHEQIAARIGRSRRWVSDRLALLDLTPQAQDAVREGATPLSRAAAQARDAAGTSRATPEPKVARKRCKACGRPL